MKKSFSTIAFVLLMITAGFASVSVKMSPTSGATVSSPVAISASASSSSGSITGWKIYVDGASVYSHSGSSSIATSLSISGGAHSITVKAWDGSGANGAAYASVTVSGTTSSSSSSSSTSTGTSFSTLESRTGWSICSGSCSGGGWGTYYLRQNIGSPSLDGNATEFHISPTTSFFDLMWYIGKLTNSMASNFQVDIYQYLKSPSAAQAIEYGLNQMGYNSQWYKFSTQCSFANGYWRVWDSYNRHWVNTSAPCRRPAANTWTHYTFQYKRYNGKAVFVSIAVNGQTYYINKAFSPEPKSGTAGNISIHYQLDGNSAGTAYSAWIDRWSLKMW